MDRREFLKFGLLASASIAAYPIVNAINSPASKANHILLLVFDAWSAHNVGFYGYPRETMPNLRKFSETATIYHNHISAGRFTVPGTASLLTGLYPWSHRAFNLGGRITPQHQDHHIFNALVGKLDLIAYAQNVYADQIIGQAEKQLSRHIPFGAFNLNNRVLYDNPPFKNDQYVAFNAFEDGIVQDGKGFDASLFLGPSIRTKSLRDQMSAGFEHGAGYYNDIPKSIESYTFESLVDGLIELVENLTIPSFVYFHIYPPHDPYRPFSRQYNAFLDDEYVPPIAPAHRLAEEYASDEKLKIDRLNYDAFLASLDAEMARFFSYAKQTGFTERNSLIITSDHGEMFDKGISGHSTPLLSQPLIHVPLIIHTPGQEQQKNVYTFTSSTDLVPTISAMADAKPPNWAEGLILPEFGGIPMNDRIVYTFDAINNPAFGSLKTYSISAIRDGLKISYYRQKEYEGWEMYDVREDPSEHLELISMDDKRTSEMKSIILAKLSEIGADSTPIG